MGIREFWIDGDGPTDQREPVLRPAAILQDQTKQVERFGMLGLGSQDLLVERFRLIEVSRRMAGDRRVEQGIDVKVL